MIPALPPTASREIDALVMRRALARRRNAGCALALAAALVTTSAAAQSADTATPDSPAGGSSASPTNPAIGTPPTAMPGSAGQSRRQHKSDQPETDAKKQKVTLPEVKVTPDPWPRLDPGAVFCRTAEDLQRHLAAVVARLDGNLSAAADPPGCSVVRAQTPVVVLSREGPGRTQVRISAAPAQSGWTDAFLPDKRTGP
jgi:hypothetical protein